VTGHRFGAILSLLRQGLAVEVEFGSHSLEAMVWVAETVERSVYEPHSLCRTADGLRFVLNNPPLRTGAFSWVSLAVDGAVVPPERVWTRPGPGSPWKSLQGISIEHPFEVRPGERTEVVIRDPLPLGRPEVRIRIEFRSVAIPPLVWFEFSDSLGPETPG